MDQFAVARQILVEQARQPEAQCGRTQHQRPCVAFAVQQRAHRMVGAQKSLRAVAIQRAAGVHAPVVHGDCHVVQQRIAARKIKIDQPADAVSFQQHIVAEQIGVDHALRQRRPVLPGMQRNLAVQQFGLPRIKELAYFRCGRRAPRTAARVGHDLRKALSGIVHLPEHRADGGALLVVRRGDGLAAQAADDAGRLAVECAEKLIVAVCHRAGTGNAVARKVCHQIQVERQLADGEFLEQREHEAAVAGSDEVIGVLDAG